MTIRDRGNIKWNSLMLVEHQRMLEKLKKEEQNREKPELDEQELQRLNRLLTRAIEKKLQVKITFYKEKQCHTRKGLVEIYRDQQSKIILNSLYQGKINLLPENIVDIKFV